MKASSETARTSRAAAPSAAPAAASAPPPARIASSQSPKRLQCSGTKISSPASISRVTTRPDADAEQDLLGEQRRAGDEAAGEPREGVLLALQRQRAGDQQDGDEGQGEGRRDGDREDFQRWRRSRRPPPCRPRSAAPAGRSAARRCRGCRAPGPAKLVTCCSEVRSGPGGSAGSSAVRICAVARRPRIWIVWPSTGSLPPSISRSR